MLSMFYLPETPSSKRADLFDALHSFHLELRAGKARIALSHAKRLQVKGYKVQFYQQKEFAVAASTLHPQELFCAPPVPPKRSRAEYIILKAIGEVKLPPPSTTEQQRCFYNEDIRAFAIRQGKIRAKLWRIFNYIQSTREGE